MSELTMKENLDKAKAELLAKSNSVKIETKIESTEIKEENKVPPSITQIVSSNIGKTVIIKANCAGKLGKIEQILRNGGMDSQSLARSMKEITSLLTEE